MSDDNLLNRLPSEARGAFAHAIELRSAISGESQTFASGALMAAGIPEMAPNGAVFPLAADHNDVQRAALEYSAIHDLNSFFCACPSVGRTRRRWLGIEPGGVLETRTVEIEHDGTKTVEPLWRVLRIARAVDKQGEVLNGLPFDVALRALTELFTVGYGYARS